MLKKWLVVAPVEGGTDIPVGQPYVILESKLVAERRRADETTSGNWGLAVLATVETEDDA